LAVFGLTCAFAAEAPPWRAHGVLRASGSGHFLAHADSTPFFWLGSTAWP
jgi:hypothetical protein